MYLKWLQGHSTHYVSNAAKKTNQLQHSRHCRHSNFNDDDDDDDDDDYGGGGEV